MTLPTLDMATDDSHSGAVSSQAYGCPAGEKASSEGEPSFSPNEVP